MVAIIKLALKELRKKKLFSLLMFIVCLIAMSTIVTSITSTTSASYQQKIFEQNLRYDMENVLHLDYHATNENQDFAKVLTDYKDYIAKLPGIKAIGQFDLTGMYFTELKTSNDYKEINAKIVAKGKYENHPDITQLLSVDEELLSLVKVDILEYIETSSGNLPIYASEIFQNTLPVGTLLTDDRTDVIYEVAGYFSKGNQWVEEDDLVRFPMVSMDGWFVAPFSDKSKNDLMTQLSCLHNTYALLSKDADVEDLKQKIADYSIQHGFDASVVTLAEEYKMYRMETITFTSRQIFITLFISVMAISSIIAIITTNILLKRKQYGVFIANGLTQKDIILCIAVEITVLVFLSTLLAWVIKLAELIRSIDLFREVLLTAHVYFTLPICLVVAVMLVLLATLLPAIKIFQYQPSELIGGNTNGND